MKRRGIGIVLATCVLAVMVLAPWVYAQAPADKPAASGGDKWEFLVAPYLWGTQIDSRVTVNGYTVDQTTYFSDIWDNMNGAFLIHAEALKGGKWGFFVDAVYLSLRDDATFQRKHHLRPDVPTHDLTLTTESWIVEGGGLYQLAKWPMEGKPGQAVTLDALGGGRYWYMSVDLDTTSPINPSRNDWWVDPFVGARVKVDITKEFSFTLRGDVGGFGVGSDISWNGVATFDFRITQNIAAGLGYRALYIDYKRSTSRARYKETFQGPMAGIGIIF